MPVVEWPDIFLSSFYDCYVLVPNGRQYAFRGAGRQELGIPGFCRQENLCPQRRKTGVLGAFGIIQLAITGS